MRDIPGHEGRYAINEDGTKLWSYPKPKKMMQGCIGWTKGRFLKIFQVKNCYWHVTLSVKDEKGRRPVSYPIHRLVAYTFIGKPSNPALEINHKDKNPSNNHFSNLEWVTRLENIRHSIKNGKKFPKWKEGRINLPKMSVYKLKKIYKLLEKGICPYQVSILTNSYSSSIDHIVKKRGCYNLPLKELLKRMKERKK